MQIVIDIPDDIYQHIAVFRHFSTYDKKYLIDAFKNCTALSENLTNGDIMKTLFPTIRVDDGGEWRHIFWGVQAKASFSQDWWNAPYKRGDVDV